MADATVRLSGPAALTTSAATQGTVPGGKSWTILTVHVCNETGTARTFTLSVGTDGPGKRAFKDFNVPANGVVTLGTNIALAATEFFQALASADSALTLIVSGVETS